jgi:hypothetical protein
MSYDGDLYPTAGATSVMTTKGDLVRYDSQRERYGIGSANQILQVKSNLPSWQTVPLADTVLTTAGDILYEDATPALARLASGTQYNNLQMGATLPTWSPSSTSVLTTTGDLLYASSANTLSRLASVASGQVLTSQGVGTAPAWASPAGGGAWTLVDEISGGDAADLTFGSVGGSDLAGYNWCRVLGSCVTTASGDYLNFQFTNATTTIASNYYSQGIFGSRVVAIAYTTENGINWMPFGFTDGTPASTVGWDFMFAVVGNGLATNNHIANQKSNCNGGNGNSCEMNSSCCTFTSASDITGFLPVAGASGGAMTPQAGSLNMSIFAS